MTEDDCICIWKYVTKGSLWSSNAEFAKPIFGQYKHLTVYTCTISMDSRHIPKQFKFSEQQGLPQSGAVVGSIYACNYSKGLYTRLLDEIEVTVITDNKFQDDTAPFELEGRIIMCSHSLENMFIRSIIKYG
jgi:hypothetical protein